MTMSLANLSPLLLLAAACDAQVDGDHQGQVLATLEGAMRTSQPAPSQTKAEVSILWVVGSGGPSFVGAERVNVEGSLPSSFKLSIFTPPTEDTMSDWDGVKFAAAYIAASPADGAPEASQAWLGAELKHVLVYLPEAPPAGSAVAGLLHGTPSAGFHVYNARKLSEAERQQKLDCITQLYHQLGYMPTRAEIFAACDGDSNDELTLAPDDLETQLDIEIVDEFGLDEYNSLPRWSGLL